MNSSATLTGCDDIIKRLREAIAAGPTPGPWIPPVHPKLSELCSPDNIAALLDRLDKAERENERLRAERDEHARWRVDLADKLHDAESQISAAWAALRRAGIQSEETVAEAIALLHAENDRLREDAERYRWLRGDACPDHSVRWTQWEVRCWVAPFWSDDLRREGLDRSIDTARAAEIGRRMQHE